MSMALPNSDTTGEDAIQLILEHVIHDSQVECVSTIREVVDAVLHGDAALFIDGEMQALVISERAYDKRSVDEPETEAVIRGPREGFIENLRTNTALVRRRLRTPQLKVETLRGGRITRTDVAVCYIRGLAPDPIVREVKQRISRIDIDSVIDGAMIEELIEDDPYSPFPQVLPTERPDIVAANLLEGRVGIIVDGSPFALIVPVTVWALLQASEDYSSASTSERSFGFSATPSLFLPSSDLRSTSPSRRFTRMLPTSLLLTVAATREGSLSSVVEALMIEFDV